MPLQAWLCDTCSELVTNDPDNGLVVWRTDRTDTGLRDYDLMIVHKKIDSDPDTSAV